jgi:hypothetical protein
MPISSSLSGLRAGMEDNLVLDAGVLYVNANITEMVAATTSANFAFAAAIDDNNTWVDPNGNTVAPRKLGATRNGTTFQINKTERQVEVDGRRTNIKGLQRVDMIDPKIVTSLLEMGDAETLEMALGSTIVTDYENWIGIRPALYPVANDYFGNITLFATVAGRLAPNGDPLPIVIVMENCRVNNIQEIGFKDKDESVLQVELTAHALSSDAFTIPCQIIIGKPLDELGYY